MEGIFLDDGAEWKPTIPSTDVRVLNGIVARWLTDPERFERAETSLDAYRREFPWPALEDWDPVAAAASMSLRDVVRLLLAQRR
ncbi:hypothetical protein [Terrabacter sp. NPDC080008]|uniref:hypothetical protein n=1 Tax=Terrabacter sp. NPDC080008 TaxID=3155176 RepID=UPI00344F967B